MTAAALGTSWQLIDLPVLRDDPLESVWYLHAQPPISNLVVGAIAASPLPEAGTTFALGAACPVSHPVVLALLGAQLGFPLAWAGVVGGLAVANPGLVSPIAAGQLRGPASPRTRAAGHPGAAARAHPTVRSIVAVAAAVTALTLTRSLLHPLWLIAALAAVVLARPVDRRACGRPELARHR